MCRAPDLNGACVKLKRIAEKKKDDLEIPVAGRSLEELPKEQWPCCVDERAAFMAPFEMEVVKRHALAVRNPNTTATSSHSATLSALFSRHRALPVDDARE